VSVFLKIEAKMNTDAESNWCASLSYYL